MPDVHLFSVNLAALWPFRYLRLPAEAAGGGAGRTAGKGRFAQLHGKAASYPVHDVHHFVKGDQVRDAGERHVSAEERI